MPKENKPYIDEVDAVILDGLTVSFVGDMKDVLGEALSK